jgi:hypothetical protein
MDRRFGRTSCQRGVRLPSFPPLQMISTNISPISCFAPVASCYFWNAEVARNLVSVAFGVRMTRRQSQCVTHKRAKCFFSLGLKKKLAPTALRGST